MNLVCTIMSIVIDMSTVEKTLQEYSIQERIFVRITMRHGPVTVGGIE